MTSSEPEQNLESPEPEEAAPLRVAVIGSGPAGIYTADALTRQRGVPVRVDVLDRLHTPYGLVRHGVAPDHTKIKGVARALRGILEHPHVTFVGGVEFGSDLTREDLARSHHAVVYATGASVDRRMGIPGEDLPGSVAATDFVNWYCGHPDSDLERFVLDAEEVAVVGAGNVALDVARILVKTADELRHTDIPQPVLDVLSRSRVRTVHVLARRGPLQAKFTAPELRDLMKLPDVDVVVRPDQVDIDLADVGADRPGLREVAKASRTNLKLLREQAERAPQGRPRRIEFHFWTRPERVLGTDGVEALRVEHTRLDDRERLVDTGEHSTLDVGMVLRSVGYAGVPLAGVPFDERVRTVPQEEGRVLNGGGSRVPGDYVAGWIKRGPTGVIGTNKSDAAATVRSLLADADALRAGVPEPVGLVELLAERGLTASDYQGWLRIDEAEAGLAAELDRGPRVKLGGWEAYRKALGRG
ncbi:FAD-dependent oxidoreductase [Nocardiopsis sp. JB363]|uniref:FAD-dependent oxidoreductase n=1 Tax=Nocardiopsis sp. JB363 TaxID=1434837 RepID=UPI00097A8D10|nr:FAD-dependent oxidoreductase [Nocardiopsis sp. JB363]SIO86203.1 Ferredoxin--NADP(+) reductase, actinobacterial (eukaryote-like) type [Nocardiopsis sp. JB363]